MDRDEILRVLRALDNAGVDYVLIGATAMGLHGVVRATGDIDLLLRADRENIERVRTALLEAYGEDPFVEGIRSADLLGDYPVVRYFPPSGDLYIDLLTKLGEMAPFETVISETMNWSGVRVRVATPSELHRLKTGTTRPLDHRDAAALKDLFDLAEDDSVRVQRFRSIEEMNAAPVPRREGDDFERFIRHNARLRMLSGLAFRRGVFRFRSLEEAQRARIRTVAGRGRL